MDRGSDEKDVQFWITHCLLPFIFLLLLVSLFEMTDIDRLICPGTGSKES